MEDLLKRAFAAGFALGEGWSEEYAEELAKDGRLDREFRKWLKGKIGGTAKVPTFEDVLGPQIVHAGISQICEKREGEQ